MIEITTPSGHRSELGEGPHWHTGSQRLSYVDINGGAIRWLDPVTGALDSVDVAPPVSFAVPVAGRSELLLGCGGDVVRIDRAGNELGRLTVERDKPGNRFNDGKADPSGRLWCGSMSMTRTPGEAGLYRIDPDGTIATPIPGTALSNGLDWDVDRARMYFIDSVTQRIDVYDYDDATGTIDGGRVFVEVDPADGLPDGLTLDADGCVWLALFGGAAIRRYDPDGVVMQTIALPVISTTCPAFGGPDLSTIFVTTTQHKMDAAERTANPSAGATFAISTGGAVTGRPGNEAAPDVADAIRTDA